MRAFSTDRPTKSNVPYTVDAGHFQYGGDFFIDSYDNTTTADTKITAWVVGNPTFKFGLRPTTASGRCQSAPARRPPRRASATPSRASNGTCSATKAMAPPSLRQVADGAAGHRQPLCR